MGKELTKAQLSNAIKDFNKKFKMDPQLETKGTEEELRLTLVNECISDIQKDDPIYPAKFAKTTVAVVDALIAEKEPAKDEKKEKKTSKNKKKETTEAPAGDLVSQIKGEMKKKVLIAFVEDEDVFKKDRKRLLAIPNHLSMRKAMMEVLAGGESTTEDAPVEETAKEKKAREKAEKKAAAEKEKEDAPVEETAKEKKAREKAEKKAAKDTEKAEKEKVVEAHPLVAVVDAAEKKKDLKAICKDNKEFKKINVKDFKEVEDLKQEMLKALVPAEPKVKKQKKEKGAPSNKQLVYVAWKKGKDKPKELHAAINENVQLSTIKSWIRQWEAGKNLPACAKKE